MARRTFTVMDVVEVSQHWHAGRPKALGQLYLGATVTMKSDVHGSSSSGDAYGVVRPASPARGPSTRPGVSRPRPDPPPSARLGLTATGRVSSAASRGATYASSSTTAYRVALPILTGVSSPSRAR